MPEETQQETPVEEAVAIDPIQEAIQESGLPHIVRTVILVLYHSLAKLVFTFCFVGMFLGPENFRIWFFVCIGIGLLLLVVLIYVLLMAVSQSLNRLPPTKTKTKALPSKNGVLLTAWRGAVGNVGFYLALGLIFAFLKLMGWIDPLFQRALQSAAPAQQQQQQDPAPKISDDKK